MKTGYCLKEKLDLKSERLHLRSLFSCCYVLILFSGCLYICVLVRCLRKSKILYTRDELLSFSNLDICKKLPRGIDASILRYYLVKAYIKSLFSSLSFHRSCRFFFASLPGISQCSELDEASVIERQRGFGGLTFQSTKRSDYGSSPPNRLEGASSYFRGSSGRWDARSSGSDTRDGDLPSNREASMQGLYLLFLQNVLVLYFRIINLCLDSCNGLLFCIVIILIDCLF